MEVNILDNLGRVVAKENTNEIDISNLVNGIYFIRIFEGNKFIGMEKILKTE